MGNLKKLKIIGVAQLKDEEDIAALASFHGTRHHTSVVKAVLFTSVRRNITVFRENKKTNLYSGVFVFFA